MYTCYYLVQIDADVLRCGAISLSIWISVGLDIVGNIWDNVSAQIKVRQEGINSVVSVNLRGLHRLVPSVCRWFDSLGLHVEVSLGKTLKPKLLLMSWSAPCTAAAAISV